MKTTWVKILFAALLPVFALTLYASESESDPEAWNDEQYFEGAYVSCLTRYESSKLARREIECVCDGLAHYALNWRKTHQTGEPLPAAPPKLFEACLNR